MLSIFEAIILGIIQGLTEWLPVSSSGHLVIAQTFLGIDQPVALDVLLHLGTLLVVLGVFRADIIAMIKSLARGDVASADGKLAIYLIIASLPIAIVGLLFKSHIESLFSNLTAVGYALLVTGTILFFTRYTNGRSELTLKNTFTAGLAQTIALVPGISRSGMTIAAGLYAGIGRQQAARFSFLLSIPAVAGATVLQLPAIASAANLSAMLIGMAASMIVGYISLKLLLWLVIQKRFFAFSFYCWLVGFLILALA